MLLRCAALCLCLLPVLCFSTEYSRKEGDKSINFSFNGLEASDYKYGIGGKYWKNNNIALTGSIDFGDSDLEVFIDNGGAVTSSNAESDFYEVSFGVERHIDSVSKVSPYMGFEVFYSKVNSISENVTKRESESSAYGISALVGVEYYVNQDISLSAEYLFSYSKSVLKSTSSGSRTKNNISDFSAGAGALVLSVYF
ncbi:MAG: outer membrane beta-barrel protein [Ectothiorhodospiraceae bacterium]|nr:outer membrane beta-barrel protein [Ectothiorhodospiraceae bacterium]